jgi:CRISPR/Cas system CMR subunit Cmr4 (Cas7 group RAMP superfamily)
VEKVMLEKFKNLFSKIGSGSSINLKKLTEELKNKDASKDGFIYSDGKGGLDIIEDIQKLAVKSGREQDTFVLNFNK